MTSRELEAIEHLDDLVDDTGLAAGDAATSRVPSPRRSDTARPMRLERREVAEQLVDLERARDAAAHALVRLERR